MFWICLVATCAGFSGLAFSEGQWQIGLGALLLGGLILFALMKGKLT